ncbi:hypothetical protein, partial [Yoonia sp. R2-816]|uniref:hypothetical protein n=1 Tax=Yoonia sp. R2-816 TaxID=3342638 RepID=UPI00372C8AE6
RHFGFKTHCKLASFVQLQVTVVASHSSYSMQLSVFVQNLHFVCESTQAARLRRVIVVMLNKSVMLTQKHGRNRPQSHLKTENGHAREEVGMAIFIICRFRPVGPGRYT